MAPNRGTGFAAVAAVAVIAGTMASSSGSARVAPTPRRNVRRGNDCFVMIMTSPLVLGRPRYSKARKHGSTIHGPSTVRSSQAEAVLHAAATPGTPQVFQ